jgi:hypothetical protein
MLTGPLSAPALLYFTQTDVNHAHGSLHLHGTSHSPVPVHLEYSRPDESMHLRLVTNGADGQEGCVLVFDAQTASDASLHPIPGACAHMSWPPLAAFGAHQLQ